MILKRCLPVLCAIAVLTACSTSHRPVYSGREESTQGVPGFVNGKKVSPHVKLGQSYTVDGETYVPRNQPDYVEEGMASWYGPGFHGGKTANGERFDSAELTAAHRTLPLPSIVRVTMVSTGKQVFVRINDRGPFAHSRIIDLSRGAAEKIGLLRAGVAKVRVEYMAEESRRFTDLLAQGRDPKSIDLASEVLNANGDATASSQLAQAPPPAKTSASKAASSSFWDSLTVSDASATTSSAPVSDVASADLPSAAPAAEASQNAAAVPAKTLQEPKDDEEDHSPFAALANAEAAPPPRKVDSAPPVAMASASTEPVDTTETEKTAPAPESAPSNKPSGGSGYYVQLGAFQNPSNAERLRTQYSKYGTLNIVKKSSDKGLLLYHVRMGPYPTSEEGDAPLAKLRAAGAEARLVHE